MSDGELNHDLPEFYDVLIQNENVLNEIIVTEQDVMDQINCLNVKKAYGRDNISPVFLKISSINLAKSLCKIFNTSLRLGIFPSYWKKASVIPLYKKDNPNLMSNYRPVSLLSTVSKLFEKIVYKYFYNHLLDIYFINPAQ